ncbi:hypothetical protein [uncultured Mediterranean phage uvMED]|nr:hypothetical protein [uncultured Mediterranean phage uvMED]
MANKRRGYYTTKLGGRERTLHFSMNFWANFTEIMKVPLDKIGDLFSGGVSISAIRALVYSAILANDQEQGNEIDYNQFKVGDWLEDIDQNELEKMIGAMMESRILGNDLNMGIDRQEKKVANSQGKQ